MASKISSGIGLKFKFWLCQLVFGWRGKFINFSKFQLPSLKMRTIMALTLQDAVRRDCNSAEKSSALRESPRHSNFCCCRCSFYFSCCMKEWECAHASVMWGDTCTLEEWPLSLLILFCCVLESASVVFFLIGCLLSFFDLVVKSVGPWNPRFLCWLVWLIVGSLIHFSKPLFSCCKTRICILNKTALWIWRYNIVFLWSGKEFCDNILYLKVSSI